MTGKIDGKTSIDEGRVLMGEDPPATGCIDHPFGIEMQQDADIRVLIGQMMNIDLGKIFCIHLDFPADLILEV